MQVTSGIWNKKGTIISASIAADESNVLEPTLIQPEGGAQLLSGTVWKMWFTGGWFNPNIYYAESTDGISWTRKSGSVVSGHLRPYVVKVGSTYHMYSAKGNPTDGYDKQIDHHTSSDGVTWSLAHSNVIPKTQTWTSTNVANSGGAYIDGTLHLFVEGSNSGQSAPWQIGRFTSTDMATFTADANNPLISTTGARGGPCGPFQIDGKWFMWVHGCPIASALPTEGFRYTSDAIGGPWTQSPSGISFPRSTVDEGVGNTVGQFADPFIIEVGGKTHMFYSASTDGASDSAGQHIKLAIAEMTLAQLSRTTEGLMFKIPSQF